MTFPARISEVEVTLANPFFQSKCKAANWFPIS